MLGRDAREAAERAVRAGGRHHDRDRDSAARSGTLALPLTLAPRTNAGGLRGYPQLMLVCGGQMRSSGVTPNTWWRASNASNCSSVKRLGSSVGIASTYPLSTAKKWSNACRTWATSAFSSCGTGCRHSCAQASWDAASRARYCRGRLIPRQLRRQTGRQIPRQVKTCRGSWGCWCRSARLEGWQVMPPTHGMEPASPR